jgi:hypothetical protein
VIPIPVSEPQESFSPKDIEKFIIELLKTGGKMKTAAIQECVKSAGMSCPDGPVRFLNILRQKGIIHGEVSVERKGWVWWV